MKALNKRHLINLNGRTEKLVWLRISIGIIYLWFGILKFFPYTSPAEELAKQTISIVTFEIIPIAASYTILAIVETLLGILFITGFQLRRSIHIALAHMLCTFMPLIVLPSLSFQEAPFTFTLVGQYIMKNIIIVCAMLLLLPKKNNKN